MQIWVDADACPKAIKEIIFRTAMRMKLMTTLVSNHALAVPPSPFITRIQVVSGYDVADNRIVQNVQPGDLVITSDIPLAAAVIDKDAVALNPRGELYTSQNIKERLSIRNFCADLRGAGTITSGPPPLNKRQIQQFANALDKITKDHSSP